MSQTHTSNPGRTPDPRACPLHSSHGPPPATLSSDDDWAKLRERYGNVAPVELEPGVQAWLLLGYRENLEALRDTRRFSNDPRNWTEKREGRLPPDSPLQGPLAYYVEAATNDGELHRRLRAPIVSAMRRLADEPLQAQIQQIADSLIDSFGERGRTELIRSYTVALPAMVLNRIFGLPDHYGYLLADVQGDIWDASSSSAQDSMQSLAQYFTGLVQRKREKPGRDVTSWIMEHESELNEEELIHTLMVMNSVGHDPTSNLIGNAMQLILTDPSLHSALADSRLHTDDLIDHVLWNDPPLSNWLGRYARESMQIGSADIRPGDGVILGFCAAHSDPLVARDDAGDFTAGTGTNRAHLSWGAGVHQCPGQHLAWQISSIGLNTLLRRLPDLRIDVPADDLRRRPSPFVRGLTQLPVSFSPVEPLRRPHTPAQPAEGVSTDEQPAETEKPDVLTRLFNWWRQRRG